MNKNLFFFLFLIVPLFINAQSIISTSGETGTSGTNWSSAGTNPFVITTSGNASIHPSVLTDKLNSGIDVTFVSNGTKISSSLLKTSGGDARLTFKDIAVIQTSPNVVISSSSNKLDIVFWADSDNSQSNTSSTATDAIFIDSGSQLISNGGVIVLGGGTDADADGLPDGYALNGSNSTNYGLNFGAIGGINLGQQVELVPP